jgi:hypothetical protein
MNDQSSLEGRRALIEEAMDSGEFFLSSIRNRVDTLQSKRDALRATLNDLHSEERSLKVTENMLKGLKISQDLRHRQEVERIKSEFKMSEELLWASKLEKEEKLKKLEVDVAALRRRKGLAERPSLS